MCFVCAKGNALSELSACGHEEGSKRYVSLSTDIYLLSVLKQAHWFVFQNDSPWMYNYHSHWVFDCGCKSVRVASCACPWFLWKLFKLWSKSDHRHELLIASCSCWKRALTFPGQSFFLFLLLAVLFVTKGFSG